MSEQKPNPELNQEYKYWAFISYSHADDDWARWLVKGLETYAVPKKLVGRIGRDGIPVPPRASPVFRDRDELPGSAKLTNNIEDALSQSRYLIVICSPNSVASQWVDQEVRIFKSMGREERVLCLITDGEPNATHRPELGLKECFPEATRFWVDSDRRITEIPTEPIAADARKGKDGKNNALLKLLAGILGVAYDDLRQRDAERVARRKRALGVAAVVAIFALMVTCWEFWLLKLQAEKETRIAEEQTTAADVARKKADEAALKEHEAKMAEEKSKLAALDSAQKERVAKEEETKAHQLAEEQRVKAVAAEKVAVEAEKNAEAAQHAAEESDRKARHTLSGSDLTAATRLIEENNPAKALAYLSRALHWDPENPAVVGRVISLLSERNWALPPEPLLHADEVNSVIYSPDGKKLLTVAGNSAKVWDTAENKELFECKHGKIVNCAAFSPDGKLLVTASSDNTAQIWDAATGQKVGSPMTHDSWVTSALFSPDGKFLATGTLNRSVLVWNVSTGQQSIRPIENQAPIHSMVFHPQKNWLLVVVKNTAQVWDISNGNSITQPFYHEGGIAAAVFSPSGNYIATASGDKTARIWDTATGQPSGEPMKHDNWVNAVAFSPDERWLVTASSDNTARVWEVPRGKPVASFHHDDQVTDVAFSPDGLWIAAASRDDTATIWDVLHEKPVVEELKHNGSVTKVAFSPDGKSLATASADRTAKIWNIISGKPVFAPMKHSQPVNTAIFSPDGQWVATASADRTARIWETGSGRPITKPLQHEGAVLSLLFSPDGKKLITGSEDGGVRVWDITTAKPALPTMWHDQHNWVNALCLSPDGKWLASASEDRTAQIWDLATGKSVIKPLQHTGVVKSVAFSADGKWLFTSSIPKTVRVWEAATGKPGPELKAGQNAEARCGALDPNPDSHLAITGFSDNTAILWDTTTGTQVGPTLVHDSPVNFVAFCPAGGRTGNKLVLTVSDRQARVWNTETGTAVTEPIKHPETIHSASFSPDGDFFATTFGNNARVWETSSGRPVTDLLVHQGPIRDARFGPAGHLLVTSSFDQSARIWFVAVQGKAPEWLGQLADGLGGYRLDEGGATQMLPDPAKNISETRNALAQAAADQYTQWGRWFLDERLKRPTSAFSSSPISQYVQQRVTEGDESSLYEALQIEPNNALALAKLGSSVKFSTQSEALTRLAEQYDPSNPEVLWIRASVLQDQSQFSPALAIMERAIQLDPRNLAAFGPDGVDLTDDDTDGILAQGWLPKGWVDQSISAPMQVTYTKLANGPQAGILALEMKAASPVPNFAQLTGPHLICKKSGRCTIEGWARSAIKSDLNISLIQLVEPHKNYYEQSVHTTPEWKQFKLQFSPQQDIAAELLIRAVAGSEIQFAGIVVRSE